MIKRLATLSLLLVFLTSLIVAQSYKIDISIISEDNLFNVGENIQLKVNLYDENNNLINDNIAIKVLDLTDKVISEKTIPSNQLAEITLSQDIISGGGKIVADYQGTIATESFFVTENEKVKFEINNGKLIITNTGNTKYSKKVYITIGETTGTKTPDLSIGKSISYRLVAPEGEYNIKVTDGETTLTRAGISLTGTGNVIGAIDENLGQSSGITGISPNKDSQGSFFNMESNKFTYIFILVILGAMILLLIERHYKKKTEQ